MAFPSKKETVTNLARALVGGCDVSEFPRYTGDWEPLYEDVRRRFEGAYRVFELEFDHEIATSIGEVREAREAAGSAEERFREACEQERTMLESGIEAAAMQRRRESATRKAEAQSLRRDLEQVSRRLRKERVALTGSEDVPVSSWPGPASNMLFWSMLAVFMGIEYLVGFELFDWVSNPNTALGLSAIVVIGFTAGTHFAVHRFRRVSGHREALLRFAGTYPGGHPEGFSVELLPSAERHVAYVLGILLAVFAVVVLVGRIWIASTSDLGFGGVASAMGLLFCFVGYGALEYYLAHPNSKDQVALLREAEAEVADTEARLKAALDPAPSEARYREATDRAIADYRAAVDAAHRRYSDNAGIEREREDLVGALYGYQLAWEIFERGLADKCRDLVENVSIRFSLKADDIAAPREDVVDAFRRSVSRKYEGSGLFEECSRRFSPIPLERPRIDMDKLKGDIEMKVAMRAEGAYSPASGERGAMSALASARAKGASG